MPCLRLEAPELTFDLSLDRDLALVENSKLAFDLLLDCALLDLEQADLPSDLLFKALKRWQLHGYVTIL